jgi:NADPH:quinone reductase-like Zn-dependent oxidoreductase
VQSKPERLSLEEAAAAARASSTARSALVDLGQVKKDYVVLVTGTAGALGSKAVQIAHRRSALVLGASRHQAEQEAAIHLGHGRAPAA